MRCPLGSQERLLPPDPLTPRQRGGQTTEPPNELRNPRADEHMFTPWRPGARICRSPRPLEALEKKWQIQAKTRSDGLPQPRRDKITMAKISLSQNDVDVTEDQTELGRAARYRLCQRDRISYCLSARGQPMAGNRGQQRDKPMTRSDASLQCEDYKQPRISDVTSLKRRKKAGNDLTTLSE